MTSPIFHAQSSVRHFGGQASDYMGIHDWMDGTKRAWCDARHRALRHSVEAIAELEQRIGYTLTNSDGSIVSVRTIAEQHCIEDMGGQLPTLNDWYSRIQTQSWMRVNHDLPVGQQAFVQAEKSVHKFAGCTDDYLPLHAWMDQSSHSIEGINYRAHRHHAWGIFELEEVFGTHIINEDGKTVPVRYIGEQHVIHDLGRVPSVSDWLGHIRAEMWMNRGAAFNETKAEVAA